MSYNIDSVEVVHGELRIDGDRFRRWSEDNPPDTWPECFEGLYIHGDKVDRIHWCGEGSGRMEDELRSFIGRACVGAAEIVLYWEGGDSVSGLVRTSDGRVLSGAVRQRVVLP